MEDTSTDTSLKKTLISFDEYKRLKNIEKQFMQLQEEKQKNLEISSGIKLVIQHIFRFPNLKLIFFSVSGQLLRKTAHQTAHQSQSGDGLHNVTSKKSKLEKLFNDNESDSEDEILYNKIVNKVTQKLTNTSPPTNLWHSSLTPATATLIAPETAPPLPFNNEIKKDDENDHFGTYEK